jgi:glyoxylase-like metal-dependent hydrolase (beta-lactamase superfamily II)
MRTNPPLPIAAAWYEIADIGNGVARILESHVAPWMRCNMWLIRGRNQDVLLDSGMGLRPLCAEVAALRERPVQAVCTHCHFDHMGGAHEFPVRLGHPTEQTVFAAPDLDNSCARAWIGSNWLSALPHEGFRLEDYQLSPAPLTKLLDEGDILDLGDRVLHVLHLPGHSPGSIALYEKATRTLFSGDAIYDGQLIDNAWHSEPEVYVETLRRLRELPVEVVHAGHFASFGRDRLVELVDQYLAGNMRLADVDVWLADQEATA